MASAQPVDGHYNTEKEVDITSEGLREKATNTAEGTAHHAAEKGQYATDK